MRPAERIGSYELVQSLGKGAMGEVWAADLHGPAGFRKPVAIKVLRQELTSTALAEHLRREARLGALLHHPNVVAVHALEELEGRTIVVMERIRGASVAQLLRRGPLPPLAVLEIGLHACAGLHHIHELKVDGRPAGLVHQDVKPGNLLVDTSGLVKVADLGIASVAGARSVAGTPAYMPPEQRRGQAEARSDVFALGVVLYVCATGERPFGTEASSPRLVARHLASSGFRASIDACLPGLGDVVARCLQPDVADRWPTAAALGEALARLTSTLEAGTGVRHALARARPDLDPLGGTPSLSGTTTVPLNLGNLSAHRDPFFGRAEEVEALASMVRSNRLATVRGPGGMGKTRIAAHAADALRSERPGGAWFFDLSEARTTDQICAVVAEALGVELEARDPVGQLGWAMRGLGEAVFVLDNLEQCVDQAPDTVGRWLDVAPQGWFLCTSRVALEIRGERVFPLGPLAVEAATELFLKRAAAEVPAAHHEDVRALVQALECLPLAVELAAARTRILPVPRMRRRVGPALLSGGGAERPARHRSLDASLRWSWDLLDEPSRLALAQLSVCEGGFDLPTAEAVVRLPPDAGWALDVLQQLVNASLVRVNPRTERFSMLVAVRGFARERLDDATGAEARHGTWFAQYEESSVAADLPNLEVACRRAVARRDGRTAVGCALGAWRILERRGPLAAGIALLESAWAACEEPRVGAALAKGLVSLTRHEESEALARHVIALARERGDHVSETRARMAFAAQLVRRGLVDEAVGELEVAREMAAGGGARREEALALAALGRLRARLGEPATALRLIGRARVVADTLGDQDVLANVIGDLGTVRRDQGYQDEALECFELQLSLYRQLQDPYGEGQALGNVATVYLSRAQLDEAQVHLEQAEAILRAIGSRRYVAATQCLLGQILHERGQLAEAKVMYQNALEIVEQLGEDVGIVRCNLGNLVLQQGHPAEARAHYEAALEVARRVGNPAAEGLVLCNLGELLRDAGELAQAEEMLTGALYLMRELGDRRLVGHLLGQLALIRAGETAWASERLDEALPLLRASGDAALLVGALRARAEVCFRAGDHAGVEAALAEAEAVSPVNHAESREILERMRTLVSDAR